MPAQALERILDQTPRTSDFSQYETIDIYCKGTVAMYTGPVSRPFDASPFLSPSFQYGSLTPPPSMQEVNNAINQNQVSYYHPEPLNNQNYNQTSNNFQEDQFGTKIEPLGNPGSPYAAKQTPDYLCGGHERYRKPEYDNAHGYHINYETMIPGLKDPIINIHIPMDDSKNR